jgi:hypothetical protein
MITTLSWRPIGEKGADDAAGVLAVLAEVHRRDTLPGRHWSSSPGAMGQAGTVGPPAACRRLIMTCLRGLWVMENLAMRLIIATAVAAAAQQPRRGQAMPDVPAAVRRGSGPRALTPPAAAFDTDHGARAAMGRCFAVGLRQTGSAKGSPGE